MKVAVVGAGAIGAYVGAALHRAGAEVHLIARGPHLAAMRRDGVRVLSPRGDFTARPSATDDPSEVGPVDYVFLGPKANSYAASGPLVHPLLHGDTAVIAAQNGIPWWYFHGLTGPHAGRRINSVDPAGTVSATLPPERAIGCVVYAATEIEAPGVVRHLEDACRVCVVEVEGAHTLAPACSRRAEPGMTVRTDSERARHSRKVVLELLASSTDLSTTPRAAEWIKEYEAKPDRFGVEAARVDEEPKVDNDLYVREYDKCILCYKCVDACGEQWQNTFAIALAGRGFDARISTEHDAPLTDSACVYCGNCIEVCPTGALSFKTEFDMRAAGTWDEQAQTKTTTICAYCGVGCNVTLHVQDNEIVKVTSPHDNPVTHGNLCIKGRFGFQHVQNRV
ncbi:2-dehydropantoate 2-reductase [Streptomyces sp. NPDC058239]|uniref:2-dehydropantoate 2-reductase n=1 Tax=Streptomyces sp. NPDC058239 TaxID=3346395 RepID=UPI0036F06183